MSAAPAIEIDRPRDRWIWSRAELVAGWIAVPSEEAFVLRISCAGRPIPVRPCAHPRGHGRHDVRGFWTILVLQEHLDAVVDGTLALELAWDAVPLRTIRVRVAAIAQTLATSHPLDLAAYPVGNGEPRAAVAPAVVFPGLGAVGGSSLDLLARRTMLAKGWAWPVYGEANAQPVWQRVCATAAATAFRWVDGHGAYAAVDDLAPGAVRVTMLREPAVRLLSAYSYGALVHPDAFPWDGFGEFVESGAAWSHTQAVGLLRMAGREPAPGMDAADLYDAARDELARSYALVGVTERFEETIFLLARLAGWSEVGMWWRVLAAPRLGRLDAIPRSARDALERIVAADRRLYDDASTALAAAARCAGFGASLARYREAASHVTDVSPAMKAVECLRWRQVLAEGALADARQERPRHA